MDKKYALPYRVIDSLMTHFLGFEEEERELPVVWHQSLLTFVQRWGEGNRPMTAENRMLRAHRWQMADGV